MWCCEKCPRSPLLCWVIHWYTNGEHKLASFLVEWIFARKSSQSAISMQVSLFPLLLRFLERPRFRLFLRFYRWLVYRNRRLLCRNAQSSSRLCSRSVCCFYNWVWSRERNTRGVHLVSTRRFVVVASFWFLFQRTSSFFLSLGRQYLTFAVHIGTWSNCISLYAVDSTSHRVCTIFTDSSVFVCKFMPFIIVEFLCHN